MNQKTDGQYKPDASPAGQQWSIQSKSDKFKCSVSSSVCPNSDTCTCPSYFFKVWAKPHPQRLFKDAVLARVYACAHACMHECVCACMCVLVHKLDSVGEKDHI